MSGLFGSHERHGRKINNSRAGSIGPGGGFGEGFLPNLRVFGPGEVMVFRSRG